MTSKTTKKLTPKQQLKIRDETIEIITLANQGLAGKLDEIRFLCETQGHRKLKVSILDIIDRGLT